MSAPSDLHCQVLVTESMQKQLGWALVRHRVVNWWTALLLAFAVFILVDSFVQGDTSTGVATSVALVLFCLLLWRGGRRLGRALCERTYRVGSTVECHYGFQGFSLVTPRVNATQDYAEVRAVRQVGTFVMITLRGATQPYLVLPGALAPPEARARLVRQRS